MPITFAKLPLSPANLRRLLVTLGGMALYRAGSFIPLPGVDIAAIEALTGDRVGLLARSHAIFSIFALGVTPIFLALTLVEFAKTFAPSLGRRERGEPAFADRLRRATLVIGLIIAAVQAYAVVRGMEASQGAVGHPGWLFRVELIVTLVGATAFLACLGEAMTRHGLGSGFWILFLTPGLSSLAGVAADLWRLSQMGVIGGRAAFAYAIAYGAAVGLAAAAVLAFGEARSPTPKRQPLNVADVVDVWPPILASVGVKFVLDFFYRVDDADGGFGAAIALARSAPVRVPLVAFAILLIAALRFRNQSAPPARSPALLALLQVAIFAGAATAQASVEAFRLYPPLAFGWQGILIASSAGVAIGASLRNDRGYARRRERALRIGRPQNRMRP